MPEEHRRPPIPAAVIGVLSAAIVLAFSLLETQIDGSATMFTGGYLHVGVAIGWIICAGLIALVISRRLKIVSNVEEGAGLAVGYDALPLLLLAAWVVMIAALVTRHWLLAAVGAVLSLYHLSIVVPRMLAARVPRWAKRAPVLDIVVANVFIDNKTPEAAARQLVTTSADVVIVVESTTAFMKMFDDVGGSEAYPHRVSDPDDHSDYAVTITCKREPGPRSQMTTIGPLRLAIADVDVDGISTLVVGLNPMATVDPGGHETWKEQIEALKEFIPTLDGPVIIAGDLNTTRYRPEFEELLASGLHDAIDALGKGLNPSFKLGADGVLATVGAVARLDHALVNDCVFPRSVENLEPCGSDHIPFELRVAVRASAVDDRGAGRRHDN
jgi:endonuclease/exonuclease/phosphatase (EEP) superfamily protein YafD